MLRRLVILALIAAVVGSGVFWVVGAMVGSGMRLAFKLREP